MSRVIEDDRVAGRVRDVNINGRMTGFINRRGRAEARYQYHGEVPQADAPALPSDQRGR